MDIYGIVSKHNSIDDKMTIPNPSQYKDIKYFEKEIKGENYHIISRSRKDSDVFYEDPNVLIVMCGTTYIGNKKATLKEFVRLYSKDKQRTLTEIKGMFNLIIIEKMSLTVKIINDHFGLMPIFYFFNKEKVVFSTKLDFVKQNSYDGLNDLEYSAILEQIYFNYILGEKTYFKNIYMQNAASILEFVFIDSKIEKREIIYWHLSEFIGKAELEYDNALELYTDEFSEVANNAMRNSQSLVIAFTAGYDTRTILAALGNSGRHIPCFSYGIRDSIDVKIPLLMSERLNINYTPLYLDGIFEKNFVDFALKTIFHSDGLGDLEKANNEYAYRYLSSKYSDVMVGIFGSELLKFPTFPNTLVPESITRCFFSPRDYSPKLDIYSFDKDLLYDFSQSTSRYIRGEYLNRYDNLTNAQKLFLFSFYEGARKYFMKELRISRYYLNIIVPFVDKKLVEILFKSELSNIQYLTKSVASLLRKQKSHFIYSYLIKKFNPDLLEMITNRGYKPKYDLSFLSRFLILPHYLIQKVKRRKPQYLYNVWAKPFVDKYMNVLETSDILKPIFVNNRIKTNINDTEKFHRLLSIAVYLRQLLR